MSNLFTLDSLREEADKKFAPVKIGMSDGTEVTLKNLLRLGKRDRDLVTDRLKTINKSHDEEGNDSEETSTSIESVDALLEAATEILSKVADDPRKLLKELDGDVGLIMQVLQTWMEGTQSGEAQSSPA